VRDSDEVVTDLEMNEELEILRVLKILKISSEPREEIS
jgi:hypothetical protein